MTQPPTISIVRTPAELEAVITLFRAYADSLDVDLSYQNFAQELAEMPGEYAPPTGELWLARNAEAQPSGCVALRAMDEPGCCEMKRLYVPPAGRGLGVGKALVEVVVQEAARIGYREIRLDTLPSMHAAIALYRRCGFATIPAYYDTPIAGTVFMRRELPAI